MLIALIETRPDCSQHHYHATREELVDVLSDKQPTLEYQELPYAPLRAGVAGPVPADVLNQARVYGRVLRVDGHWLTPDRAPTFARWLNRSARVAFGVDLRVARPEASQSNVLDAVLENCTSRLTLAAPPSPPEPAAARPNASVGTPQVALAT